MFHDENWIVKVTDTYWGEDNLSANETYQAMINIGYEGIGVEQYEFDRVKEDLLKADDSWYCTWHRCYSEKTCSELHGWVPDYTLTFDARVNYTIAGNDLISPYNETIDNKPYQCKFDVYHLENTWYVMLLGDTFLKNYYSVYDSARRQIGLGKLVEDISTTSDGSVTPDTGSDSTGSGDPYDPVTTKYKDERTALLVVIGILSIVAIGLLIAVIVVKLQQSSASKSRRLSMAAGQSGSPKTLV